MLSSATWGTTPAGETVAIHRLANAGGVEVTVAEYGGAVVSVRAPDGEGRLADVTLGYDALEGYRTDEAYLGVLVGRYGNRIAGGRFTLDGRKHRLPVNNGSNHLHGGPAGFSRAVWSARPYTGNWLDGIAGKGGARYDRHAGIALETQHFPDSPNRPAFPSTILRPGEEHRSRTVYRFGASG